MSKFHDITQQPWLAASLQFNTLTRLQRKISTTKHKEIEERIVEALKGIEPRVQYVGPNPKAAMYTTQWMQSLTGKAIWLHVKLTSDEEEEFNGVTLRDLLDKPVIEIGNRAPIQFLLIATYRAVVQNNSGFYPGLACNISLAGIHAMLAQFDVMLD